MANELIVNYPSGSTLYALLFDATGQIWNGSSFVAPASANWLDYDIAMTEVATATGVYRASMPAAEAGVYGWTVRKQAGGTPAVSDITVGVGRIEWTGTAEIMPASTTNITAGTINSVTGTISADVVSMNGDTDPVDNLVLALGTGGISDKLDALIAALATADITVVSAVDGGLITIYQAVSFSATISGLAIPADWTKVYWTVKRATSEADTDAILQIVETNPSAGTDGLLRVNGAAGTAANGTLTVNQAAGTVAIDLVMTVCDDLALATGLVWSLKALHPTSAATLLAIGTVNVLGQATAAVA